MIKHFIVVIGVAGAGKSTFISENFSHLPVDYLCDSGNYPLLFHDEIQFKTACLEITGFEEIVADILIREILDKGNTFEIYYIFLDDLQLHKQRVLKRGQGILDIEPYSISKNVFDRTRKTIKDFVARYDDTVKCHMINNSAEIIDI